MSVTLMRTAADHWHRRSSVVMLTLIAAHDDAAGYDKRLAVGTIASAELAS
jgi:hypothetical protein